MSGATNFSTPDAGAALQYKDLYEVLKAYPSTLEVRYMIDEALTNKKMPSTAADTQSTGTGAGASPREGPSARGADAEWTALLLKTQVEEEVRRQMDKTHHHRPARPGELPPLSAGDPSHNNGTAAALPLAQPQPPAPALETLRRRVELLEEDLHRTQQRAERSESLVAALLDAIADSCAQPTASRSPAKAQDASASASAPLHAALRTGTADFSRSMSSGSSSSSISTSSGAGVGAMTCACGHTPPPPVGKGGRRRLRRLLDHWGRTMVGRYTAAVQREEEEEEARGGPWRRSPPRGKAAVSTPRRQPTHTRPPDELHEEENEWGSYPAPVLHRHADPLRETRKKNNNYTSSWGLEDSPQPRPYASGGAAGSPLQRRSRQEQEQQFQALFQQQQRFKAHRSVSGGSAPASPDAQARAEVGWTKGLRPGPPRDSRRCQSAAERRHHSRGLEESRDVFCQHRSELCMDAIDVPRGALDRCLTLLTTTSSGQDQDQDQGVTTGRGGVRVLAVDDGGAASDAGLLAGDVVLEVVGLCPVECCADLKWALHVALEERDGTLDIVVYRPFSPTLLQLTVKL